MHTKVTLMFTFQLTKIYLSFLLVGISNEITVLNLKLGNLVLQRHPFNKFPTAKQDMLQHGLYQATKASRRWDSNKGAISTFLVSTLNGTIRNYIRDVIPVIKVGRSVNYFETVKVSSYDQPSKVNPAYTWLEEFEDTKNTLDETKVELELLLENLEDKDQYIVYQSDVMGVHKTEIAKHLGVSKSTVQDRYKKSMQKLKNLVTE